MVKKVAPLNHGLGQTCCFVSWEPVDAHSVAHLSTNYSNHISFLPEKSTLTFVLTSDVSSDLSEIPRELRDMALRDIEWHRPGFRSRTEWVRLGDFCHRTTVSVLIKSQWHYLKAYAWQPGAGQGTTFGLWCGKIGPRFSAQTQGWLCWTEAGIMRSACLYGSSLGLCWAQVVPMLGQVGPIGPSWSPKPRKNRGFVTSPRWNSFPPKGPKHPKKR